MQQAEAAKRVADVEKRMRAMEARAVKIETSVAAAATNVAAMGDIKPAFLEILAVGLLGTALFLGWQIGVGLLQLLFWLGSFVVMLASL